MSGRQIRRWMSQVLILAAVAGVGAAWGQFNGPTGPDKYNPFEYSKEPTRWKAPPVPKPYSEDKQNRYYTLADFKPNDKNLKKFTKNLDAKKQPVTIDGAKAKYALCYLERGDLENFVEYWLAGRFKTFECTLMVPESFNGKLIYYVYGDDKKLIQGDDLGAERKTAHITLSVEGVRRLVLKTTGAASTENLPVVWANPTLTETKDDE